MSKDLILGSWGISGAFGNQDDAHICKLFEHAEEVGIDTVDTAIVYGDGRIESLLQAFPRLKLATKLPASPKPPQHGMSKIAEHYRFDQMCRQVEDILRRTRRETIDVLQLHNWCKEWSFDDVHEFFSDLKRSGKVQRSGVSLPANYDAVIPQGFDVVQLPFNLIETWATKYWGDVQHSRVWARAVLAHGALTDRLYTELSANDTRREKFVSLLPQVEKYKSDHHIETPQLKEKALAFVARAKRIDGVILGCTTIDQIDHALQFFQNHSGITQK
jgi:aryl-alcohol dehydrogenase-like predicted oxidoreductase